MINEVIYKELLTPLKNKFKNLNIYQGEELVSTCIGTREDTSLVKNIIKYEDREVGKVEAIGASSEFQQEMNELGHSLAPLFVDREKQSYLISVFNWVLEAKKLRPEVCDWIGIYFRASYLLNEQGTDLVLGPFIGEATDHIRISLDRGYCGMALREERVVNIEDVTTSNTYIACSLSTRSELVIPLKNSKGQFIAELDIDSNKRGAFSTEIESLFKEYCLTFSSL